MSSSSISSSSLAFQANNQSSLAEMLAIVIRIPTTDGKSKVQAIPFYLEASLGKVNRSTENPNLQEDAILLNLFTTQDKKLTLQSPISTTLEVGDQKHLVLQKSVTVADKDLICDYVVFLKDGYILEKRVPSSNKALTYFGKIEGMIHRNESYNIPDILIPTMYQGVMSLFVRLATYQKIVNPLVSLGLFLLIANHNKGKKFTNGILDLPVESEQIGLSQSEIYEVIISWYESTNPNNNLHILMMRRFHTTYLRALSALGQTERLPATTATTDNNLTFIDLPQQETDNEEEDE